MNTLIIALLVALIILTIIAIILLITRGKSSATIDTKLIEKSVESLSKEHDKRFDKIETQLKNLSDQSFEHQIKQLEILDRYSKEQTRAVTDAVKDLQESNEQKLESIRTTVDEKLNESLGKRLNESFKTVSEQLNNVYISLGEMQKLSGGVTESVNGLNRVLSNVKSRGTWAEVQLGNILDETIPSMYKKNVRTNPGYNGQVEFAVIIPSLDNDTTTYLPIDSKFPIEDYNRITQAAESGDATALAAARKALESRVYNEGKEIKKYINEPNTTPFAILYLATEGLYSEILSGNNDVAQKLHKENVLLAGPSTITALLNSLSIGFRSIAINQKANEVWKILAVAKAQYDDFGKLLIKAKAKIDDAGRALDEADHRNNIIQKKLKNVESIETYIE